MRRAAVWSCVGVGGLAAWLLAASCLFVHFGGLSGMLGRPWMAWWDYAANSPDGWTATLLAASGVLPLVLMAGVALAAWRLRRRFPGALGRPLYGDSQWATDAEMRAGGLRRIRIRR